MKAHCSRPRPLGDKGMEEGREEGREEGMEGGREGGREGGWVGGRGSSRRTNLVELTRKLKKEEKLEKIQRT